jgi:hypothetical protein
MQPFVSMLRPRAHEFTRVKEKEEEEEPGRRSAPKQPPRDVYIITRTKNHMAFPKKPM